jgi:hypothetical protein
VKDKAIVDSRMAKYFKSAEKAILLENICFWTIRNRLNNRNFHEEKYWIYNTAEAWTMEISWRGRRAIADMLEDLAKKNFIFRGRFSRDKYDRTWWFSANFDEIFSKFPHMKMLLDKTLANSANAKANSANAQANPTIPSLANSANSSADSSNLGMANSANDSAINQQQTNSYLPSIKNINKKDQDFSNPEPQEREANASEPRQDSLTSSQSNSDGLFQEKNTKALWDYSDPLKSIYANLVKLEICRRKFNDKDYSVFLGGLIDEYNIDVGQMIKLAFEWQEYHNEKTAKPKVPKSSFRTWVKNYAERRNSQAYRGLGGGRKQTDPNAGMMQHGVDYEKEMW